DLFAWPRRGRRPRRASAVAGGGGGPGAARDAHRRGARAGAARGAGPDAQARVLPEARLRARGARAVPAQGVGGLCTVSATKLLRRDRGCTEVVGTPVLSRCSRLCVCCVCCVCASSLLTHSHILEEIPRHAPCHL